MTATETAPVIPHAWENEDGGTFWIEGHIDPALAVLAVVVTTMVDVGAHEALSMLFGDVRDPIDQRTQANGVLRSVRHVWMKPDPKNDENMLPARADEPGAQAWSRLTVYP